MDITEWIELWNSAVWETATRPQGSFDPQGPDRGQETSTNWKTVRDQGIDRATRGAPEEWLREARRALDQVCHDRLYFTSWDVYQEMDPQVRDLAKGQALGGVLMKAHRQLKKCVPTDRTRNEQQARNHGRPQRVWESYLYLEVDDEGGTP